MRDLQRLDLNIASTPSLARRAVDEGLPIDPITAQRLIAANAECMRVLEGNHPTDWAWCDGARQHGAADATCERRIGSSVGCDWSAHHG